MKRMSHSSTATMQSLKTSCWTTGIYYSIKILKPSSVPQYSVISHDVFYLLPVYSLFNSQAKSVQKLQLVLNRI